jgi:hypothetical protein
VLVKVTTAFAPLADKVEPLLGDSDHTTFAPGGTGDDSVSGTLADTVPLLAYWAFDVGPMMVGLYTCIVAETVVVVDGLANEVFPATTAAL